MEQQKKRYKYRRTIMLLCRLLLLLAVTGLFLLIWDVSYTQTRFYYKGNFVVILIYCLVYFAFNSMYGGFKTGSARYGEVLYSNGLALVFVNVVTYLQLSLVGRRMLEAAPMVVLWLLQFFTTTVITYFSNFVYFKIYPVRDVLIICRDIERAERLTARVKSIRERYKLQRIMTQEKDPGEIKRAILRVNTVMISDIDLNLRNEIVDFCYEQGVRVYIVPNVEDIIISTAQSTHIFDSPVLLCKNYQLTTEQRLLKRGVDILVSAFGLILASPFMLAVALAIKLYDGGPVLYRQRRLTDHDRVFELYKFRSMRVDAERDGVARLAQKNDERITPVGKVIRATRLDELPQLINILRGDMSVVGPRPERPELVEENIKQFPEFKYRTKVKAGLTGYAQVYGKYNTTPEDKLLMDLLYIERYSLLMDFKLMFLTFKILFLKDSTEGVDAPEQNHR
ncbi:sugar transferase [Harryflintia acetispora]|uniref:sugar transferase n=1 Tax=Harryflintia acetispora TaxID=1849041 RepID=UPI00189A3F13|nr:sugar transferase [Harryflintia acetispora]